PYERNIQPSQSNDIPSESVGGGHHFDLKKWLQCLPHVSALWLVPKFESNSRSTSSPFESHTLANGSETEQHHTVSVELVRIGGGLEVVQDVMN
ncbi:hypothetical protein E4U56_007488, partial [Claviceps arundinis]